MAKLCEIYFVWGNRDAFVQAAERLDDQLGGESTLAATRVDLRTIDAPAATPCSMGDLRTASRASRDS